jgi:hypothetical protein
MTWFFSRECKNDFKEMKFKEVYLFFMAVYLSCLLFKLTSDSAECGTRPSGVGNSFGGEPVKKLSVAMACCARLLAQR